jgi:DNA-binding MarR family transcriptional regulator
MSARRRYARREHASDKVEGRTPQLVHVADRLTKTRRLREDELPHDLSNTRAWDLLLALYAEGEMITTQTLKAGGVPHASGLRLLDRLDSLGLTQRRSPPDNFRVALVSLTADGYSRMTRLLARIAELP